MRRKRPDHELAAMAGVIRAWRIHRGLDQKELGTKCGWSAGAQISKYETGSQWPDEQSLERIARVLEIDPGLLVAQAQELAGEIARHGASRGDSTGGEPDGGSTGKRGWTGEGHLPEELRRRRRELLIERRDLEERWLLLQDEIRIAAVRMVLAETGGGAS